MRTLPLYPHINQKSDDDDDDDDDEDIFSEKFKKNMSTTSFAWHFKI